MPDVFISYSRRDQEFVRELATELDRRGKDAWVDWEDIPPTADWLARIKAGIEEATVFVFVISPDSVASVVCGQEVAHAAATGKRIVPVLLREVDPAQTPGTISAHNWISFVESRDYEKLTGAIDTDLPWVEAHTRWLGEAADWDRHDRDGGFLLRGTALTAAEAWLEEGHAGDKDPPVTPLQYEHILASRRAASRRARSVTGAVTLALVVAVGLAVLAFLQRQQAVDQREQAQARELVATSALNLEQDPELSIALAARAARMRATTETEEALRRALLASFVRETIRVPGGALSAQIDARGRVLTWSDGLARLWQDGRAREFAGAGSGALLSPDGSRVLTLGDADVRVHAADDGRLEHTLRAGPKGLVNGAWSPDGARLVTAAPDGVARVWDAASGELEAELDGRGGALVNAEFSPDGRRVAAGSGEGVLTVWDLDSGAVELRRRHDDFIDAAFTPDGSKVLAIGGSRVTHVYDAQSGRELSVLRGVASGRRSFALSPDGDFAVTGTEDGSAMVWRLRDGRRLQVLSGHQGAVSGVAVAGQGIAATAGAEGTVRVWEYLTGRTLAVLRGHEGGVNGVAFDPRGRRLVSVGVDDSARVWQPGPPGVTGESERLRLPAGTRGFAGDSRRVFVAPPGRAQLATREGRVVSELERAGAEAFETASAGDTLAVRWNDGTVQLRAGDRVVDVGDGIETVALARDGRSVGVGGGGEVAISDARTGKPRRRARIAETSTAMSLAFTPSGGLLASSQERLVLLDPRLKVVRRLRGGRGGGFVSEVAVSRDGRLLAATYGDGQALVWRADTGAIVARLEHELAATDVSFSPDGRFLLTGSDEGWTRVWEISSGTQLLRVAGLRAAWAADGRFFATVDERTGRVWACEVCRGIDGLLRLADERVTRPLTAAERARYLHE